MSRIYGVMPGTVVDVDDPQAEGRVKVQFDWMEGNHVSYWAPVATLMTGPGRGTWFRPETGDEVLVAFDRGDAQHPYIVGYLWNGASRPPSTDHDLRLIRSVNGHEIAIYDPDVAGGDAGYIRIQDAHGNRIELGNARISITSVGAIDINAPAITINGRPVVPAPKPI